MRGKYTLRKLNKLNKKIKETAYEKKRQRRIKKLKNHDFTVISNNCWAGNVYRYFNMPYMSPTVGLYFFAHDYIKFVSNLKHYLSCELKFIAPEQSRYYDVLVEREQDTKPIGIIDDVEIVFLHYKTREEAKEKWDRRKARVNFDNIVLKFSQMNLCTEKEMREFDSLKHERKFMFTARKHPELSCAKYYSGYEEENVIKRDTNEFPKGVNILKILNAPKCKYEIVAETSEN